MTFFKKLMQVLAAVGSAAAVMIAPKLIALFQGPAPSDVSTLVWGVVGIVGVFLVNWAVGKIPAPAPE